MALWKRQRRILFCLIAFEAFMKTNLEHMHTSANLLNSCFGAHPTGSRMRKVDQVGNSGHPHWVVIKVTKEQN
jgi:hypothetical protein